MTVDVILQPKLKHLPLSPVWRRQHPDFSGRPEDDWGAIRDGAMGPTCVQLWSNPLQPPQIHSHLRGQFTGQEHRSSPSSVPDSVWVTVTIVREVISEKSELLVCKTNTGLFLFCRFFFRYKNPFSISLHSLKAAKVHFNKTAEKKNTPAQRWFSAYWWQTPKES